MHKCGQTGHSVDTDNIEVTNGVKCCSRSRTEIRLFCDRVNKSITTTVTLATCAVSTVQTVFISAHNPRYFIRDVSVSGYDEVCNNQR